tara:strand:- start:2068 stop:2517 length:450 start_codon:yes stop_codon:yes gene_type:complete
MIDGIIIKDLKKIADERGAIFHMLKKSDTNFSKFGEIYFATAYPGVIKGWHLHTKQEQNYAVIKGMIKLVLYDDRQDSKTKGELMELFLGDHNYKIVKIPPGIINGWKNIGTKEAILANCSDLEHEKDEMKRIDPFSNKIPYKWDIVFK